MPREYVKDANGDTMLLLRFHKGRLGCQDWVEHSCNNMADYPLREDDVLVCSYAKSGCHWLWETIRIMQNGRVDVFMDKEGSMMEFKTFDYLDSLPSPRVLNNHSFFDNQPKDILRKNVKVVFVYRNPKDVAVSFFYHHTRFWFYEYKGSWENYLHRFVDGLVDNNSMFEYLREWDAAIKNTPELNVHVVMYEDMKEDPLSEVRRLAHFLNKDYSDDFLQTVVSATGFQALKDRKDPYTVKDGEGKSVIYRKGEVGDWKNHFTVAQNEWFDDIIQRELAGTSFNFRYTLDQ